MGTLVHDPFYEEMPAFFGMSLKELMAAKHETAWLDFEHGEMEEETFLECFFADGRDYDRAGFLAHVMRSYRWLEGVPELLAELAQAGYAMHALSNYPVWWRGIEKRLGLSRYLEWSFVSCDMGVRKPHPEAYKTPLRRLDLPPSACLFVDDRSRNVVAARKLGLDGILYRDTADLRRRFAARGILPHG